LRQQAVSKQSIFLGGGMRVTIRTKATYRDKASSTLSRLVRAPEKIKEYQVSLGIDLSEEERAIITEHQLWDVEVLTRPFFVSEDELKLRPMLGEMQGKSIKFRIQDLASEKGFHQVFLTPLEAMNFRAELKNDVLPKLKKYVDASLEFGSGTTETFDL
jgi:hypothetical protein